MYHGSDQLLDIINPKHSNLIDADVVFGTPSKYMASCFIPRWTDEEVEMGHIDGRLYIKELVSDALTKWHCSGYIYQLDSVDFSTHENLGMRDEFISYVSHKPKKVIYVNNVIDFIKDHIDIHTYIH